LGKLFLFDTFIDTLIKNEKRRNQKKNFISSKFPKNKNWRPEVMWIYFCKLNCNDFQEREGKKIRKEFN
jgi:hypothetical protein